MTPKHDDIILEVRDLHIDYHTSRRIVRAVENVNLSLERGRTLGIVGESGSGKSTLAYGILRLLPASASIVRGQIILNGQDITLLDEKHFRSLRWRDLAFIPQGAMNALNPTMRVHAQIADVIETHEGVRCDRARITELLRRVDLPETVLYQYPHQLSGGMKQRVCIAMATALHPSVIVADEFTSALDVITQRAVARMLLRVQRELGITLILIGHDLSLMAQMVDRIAVMQQGRIIELADVHLFFQSPAHPFSKAMIHAVPVIGQAPITAYTSITPRGLQNDDRQHGCAYAGECPAVMARCLTHTPHLQALSDQQSVACHLYARPDEK